MGSPSVATIKRLFAVSGNRCAFPRCSQHLVDQSSGKVVGRICHIKAASPGGPRYDASQTEDQRHGFENLVIACPVHHDVIDDDPESYTVERLQKIKATHEHSSASVPEPTEDVVRGFIANISENKIVHGSLIFTQNQMGGQVAHSIQNFGPQPRRLATLATNALIAELRKHPAEHVDVTCIMGDPEGLELASHIKQTLEAGGWSVNGVNQAVFTQPIRAVRIEVPSVKASLTVLLNWFGAVGLNPQGFHIPEVKRAHIVIGSNL